MDTSPTLHTIMLILLMGASYLTIIASNVMKKNFGSPAFRIITQMFFEQRIGQITRRVYILGTIIEEEMPHPSRLTEALISY